MTEYVKCGGCGAMLSEQEVAAGMLCYCDEPFVEELAEVYDGPEYTWP